MDPRIKEQEKMAARIQTHGITTAEIRTVAGIDTAYWQKDDKEYGVCVICVFDHASKKQIECVHAYGEVTTEYIPGLLAYRELPLILEAYKKLRTHVDLLLFDGNGILHPRHMGIASHASLVLGIPSMGIAKTFYHYGDGRYSMPENVTGAYTDIVVNGQVDGRALRTAKDVKPIFVSIGNRIDLDTACSVAMHYVTKRSHIPLPTREADLETKRLRKLLKENTSL